MGYKSSVSSYYNYKISQNSTSHAIDKIKINDKFISFVYAKENVYKEQNSVEIANLKFSVDPAGSYYKQPPLLKYEKTFLYYIG